MISEMKSKCAVVIPVYRKPTKAEQLSLQLVVASWVMSTPSPQSQETESICPPRSADTARN